MKFTKSQVIAGATLVVVVIGLTWSLSRSRNTQPTQAVKDPNPSKISASVASVTSPPGAVTVELQVNPSVGVGQVFEKPRSNAVAVIQAPDDPRLENLRRALGAPVRRTILNTNNLNLNQTAAAPVAPVQ